jgi:hypothetical protein
MSNDIGFPSRAYGQTHEMATQDNASESNIQEKSTFSMIGQINSLVITFSEEDFNIANAFKVILSGEWNLSVDDGKITTFGANFLASPMDGTKGPIHQISNFKSTTENVIELTQDNNLSVDGTADIKINGINIWEEAHISILISNGNTITIDPDDNDTEDHFGGQPIYGIVTRLIS